MKKYLTVQEAATTLSTALNRGVHLRDIADLAREKTITPVVFFEGYIGDIVTPKPNMHEYDPDRSFSGESFSGYLHSSEMKNMIDCIVKKPLYLFTIYEFTEKRIITKYQKGDWAFACCKSYSQWKSPKNNSFSLFYSNNGFPFFSTSDIRIPSIEVESIIEKHRSSIAERQDKKGLPLEFPTQPVTTAEPITTLQAKEHTQQLPEKVTTPPKKTDPRELASCHKLISTLLDLAGIDTSQPYKAAGLIDAHTRTKGFPTLSETKIVDLIESAISIRNKD